MNFLTLFGVQTNAELAWVCVGFGAQMLFGMRFIVQWWQSEKAGQSVIPVSFWYFSVLGGVLMLAYAVYRWDPVFMFGQVLGLAVYLRNLRLILRKPQSP